MSRGSVSQGRRLRLTPTERAFPISDEFLREAPQLLADLEEQMLTLVWRGYDRLAEEYGPEIAVPDDRQIERDIASALASYMTLEHDPLAGFHVQHEAPEIATAASDGAHPPACDIAFILNVNRRIRWPLEAKVLQNERGVGAYVAEVRDNLLTGRYAPFCLSAGLLGFLLAGRPEVAADRIAEKLSVALKPLPPYYPERPHYRSRHHRNPNYPGAVSGTFTCHHLIMPMSGPKPGN